MLPHVADDVARFKQGAIIYFVRCQDRQAFAIEVFPAGAVVFDLIGIADGLRHWGDGGVTVG